MMPFLHSGSTFCPFALQQDSVRRTQLSGGHVSNATERLGQRHAWLTHSASSAAGGGSPQLATQNGLGWSAHSAASLGWPALIDSPPLSLGTPPLAVAPPLLVG